MKRPSFQFYPADWRNNAKLRRCSEAARGAWMDILCVLHDSDEYGVVRWPLADIARAAGVPIKLAKELAAKDVLKGADKDAAPYVYTPRHAGKSGEPVTLVAPGDGPCWYCSRFVRDEWVRQRRGGSTQFSTDNQPPKTAPKSSPKGGIGERQGDGPTSTSPSTPTEKQVGESTVVSTPPSSKATIPNPPTCEAHWAAHFRQRHGFEVNASSVHDRRKAWPIFAGWVNAGLTLERVDAAVAQAIAQATEPIAYLPGYVDRVIASQAAHKPTATAARDQERADVIATLTGRKPAHERTADAIDVAARRVD